MKVINHYIVKNYNDSYDEDGIAHLYECENDIWYVQYLSGFEDYCTVTRFISSIKAEQLTKKQQL